MLLRTKTAGRYITSFSKNGGEPRPAIYYSHDSLTSRWQIAEIDWVDSALTPYFRVIFKIRVELIFQSSSRLEDLVMDEMIVGLSLSECRARLEAFKQIVETICRSEPEAGEIGVDDEVLNQYAFFLQDPDPRLRRVSDAHKYRCTKNDGRRM